MKFKKKSTVAIEVSDDELAAHDALNDLMHHASTDNFDTDFTAGTLHAQYRFHDSHAVVYIVSIGFRLYGGLTISG